MARFSITAPLAFVAAAAPLAQELEPRLDESFVVELRAGDEPLRAGRGPSRAFDYTCPFRGTLYAWAESEALDPIVRVEVPGRPQVAEDDGSRGRSTPCTSFQVVPGQELRIAVAALEPDAVGAVEVRLVSAPETDATLEASRAGRRAHGEVLALRDAGRIAEARSLAVRAIDELLAVEGAKRSTGVALTANDLGPLAQDLGALDAAAAALGQYLQFHEHTRPALDLTVARALNTVAIVSVDLGDYDTARRHYERALAIREQVRGPDHPDTAESLNNLAILLDDLGEYDASRGHFERALAIRESAFGPEHSKTADSLNNLAALLESLGDYQAARPLYERALAIRESALGPEHPETADCLSNLANVLTSLGEYGDARYFYERALAIREDGSDPVGTARALNNLATLHVELGEYAAARPQFERALAICERVHGAEHPALVPVLNNLAGLLGETGDSEAARKHSERALAICESAFGPEHPATALALQGLAELSDLAGDHDAARPHYERVLEIWETVLGPGHPLLAQTLDRQGSSLTRLGRYDEARALLERSLAIRRNSYGDEHPRTARSLRNLSLLAQAEGGLERALPLLERALAIEERQLGRTSPATAESLHALASIQLDQGRLLAAMRTAERALEMRSARFGERHPDVGRSRHLLGKAVLAMGELDEAELHLAAALESLTATLGGEHLDTAACRETLASLYVERASLEPAVELLVDVLRVRTEKLGGEHVETLECRGALAHLLFETGALERARGHFEALLRIGDATLDPDHAALQETRRQLIRVLEDLGRSAAAEALREAAGEGREYAPILTVLTPAASPADTEERRIVVDALVTDPIGVKDVLIEQDGVVTSASAVPGGLELDETGRRARVTYTADIPKGTNETYIRLRAINRRGRESASAGRLVRYSPATRELYLLAFGVSDYEDDELDLAYPEKDVDDLIARMKREEGRTYDAVHVRRLAGELVTPGALRRARTDFLRRAQPQDTIVVFAAGHGVRTETGDYYFLTSACTPDDPFEGIDRATLESLVTWDHLYATRRVLLIDTCHAGESLAGARGEARGQAVFDQLEVDVAVDGTLGGLYILAASSDTGFAREMEGNGLFTRALLAGLSGEADRNGNDSVEIEELKDFAAERVHTASGGRQRPTVPTVRGGENFPLVRVLD